MPRCPCPDDVQVQCWCQRINSVQAEDCTLVHGVRAYSNHGDKKHIAGAGETDAVVPLPTQLKES